MTEHYSSNHRQQQLLLSMMQGSYDEPNPLLVLKPSSLANTIIGRRKYVPTNRMHTMANNYEPTLMTNLQTGKLHYRYNSKHSLTKHFSEGNGIDHTHYDIIEQYPLLNQEYIHRNSDNYITRVSIFNLIESLSDVLQDITQLWSPMISSWNIIETPMLIESVQRFYHNASQLYEQWWCKRRRDDDNYQNQMMINHTDSTSNENKDRYSKARKYERRRRKRFLLQLTRHLLSDPTCFQVVKSVQQNMEEKRHKVEAWKQQQTDIQNLQEQITKLWAAKHSCLQFPSDASNMNRSAIRKQQSSFFDPWSMIIPGRDRSQLKYPFSLHDLVQHLSFLKHNNSSHEQLEQFIVNETEQGMKWNNLQLIIEKQLLLHIYEKAKANMYDHSGQGIERIRRILLESRIKIRRKSIVLCALFILKDLKMQMLKVPCISATQHSLLKHVAISLRIRVTAYLFQDYIQGFLDYIQQQQLTAQERGGTLLFGKSDLRELLVRRDSTRSLRLKIWRGLLPDLI